jgi:hypothetical protein
MTIKHKSCSIRTRLKLARARPARQASWGQEIKHAPSKHPLDVRAPAGLGPSRRTSSTRTPPCSDCSLSSSVVVARAVGRRVPYRRAHMGRQRGWDGRMARAAAAGGREGGRRQKSGAGPRRLEGAAGGRRERGQGDAAAARARDSKSAWAGRRDRERGRARGSRDMASAHGSVKMPRGGMERGGVASVIAN